MTDYAIELNGVCKSYRFFELQNVALQLERGTIMGLWCSNYALGGFVASVYAGYAGWLWGWRYAFYVPAATQLLIWLLFLWLQRDRPEDVGLPSIEEYHGERQAILEQGETPAEEPEGSWKVIVEVWRNPMVLLLAAVASDGVAPEEAGLREGCVLMIGNEGAGLGAEWLEIADARITLRCTGRVESLNAALGATLPIDEFRVCYHDDRDGCDCRKPKPGLLLQPPQYTTARSVMVGDRWRDIEAGRRSRCLRWSVL